MATGVNKNFLLEGPSDEIQRQLRAIVVEELNDRKSNNLPIVYKNALCIFRNQFIHEYPDGRRFLISQNQQNSSEEIISQLY